MVIRLSAVVLVALSAAALVIVPERATQRSINAEVTNDDCVVDIADVIGWWRGEDDGAATTGPDLAGNTVYGDAVAGRGFVLGGGSLSADGLEPVATALTVEMWVKPFDAGFTGQTQALLSRWDFPSTDDSARAFELLLDPYSNLIWATDETSTRRPEELRAAAPQLFDGNFHHVAATWDQSQFALYVDGNLIGAKASQGGTLNPASATPFRLGSTAGLGTQLPFHGTIDEPTVWARALSEGEIATIYAADGDGKCSFVPSQRAKLNSSPGAFLDEFGYAVGIDGGTVVVGAPLSSVATQFAGAAYVYTHEPAGWSQQARLLASDRRPSDQLGHSVAIDGNTIALGSYGNDNGGPSGTNSGAVYVFARTGTTWTQQAKLAASDAAAGDGFGYSVAIDGDTIVVGAPLDDDPAIGGDAGATYVFTRSGATWSEQAKLTASDGAVNDQFGLSVAVDQDVVAIGSPLSDVNGSDTGAAYVFDHSGTAWTQSDKIIADDAAASDLFGNAVAVTGNVVLVGSPLDDDAGIDSGSAYVFTREMSVWTQGAKLVASDAAPGDGFGYSVAVSGSTAVVGAYLDDDGGVDSGAVYVFSGPPPSWEELTKLVADDAAPGDYFGRAVDVSGSIVVGAYLDDDQGANSGSAYVFAS